MSQSDHNTSPPMPHSLHQDGSHQDGSRQDGSRQDSAHQDSAHQDSIDSVSVNVLFIDEKLALPHTLSQTLESRHRPTLVLVGGASKLSDEDLQRVQAVFTDVLAPLAEEFGLNVVDGGTDAGVMRLMGNARTAIAGTFPLIGVAPTGLVNLPGKPALCEDAADLEPNHTHCLLVPGSHWGEESPWIADVATELAIGYGSVVVLINGGNITWVDAQINVSAQRPVIVLAGSGRAADVLARAIAGEPVDDERAQPLVESGLLSSVELYQANSVLAQEIKRLLQLN